MFRALMYSALAVGLSACAASRPADQARQSFDQLEQIASVGFRDSHASAGNSEAAAIATMPAEAGRIARVSQTQYGDGTRQLIVFDNPVAGLDPSVIEVRVRTSEKPPLEDSLAVAKPTKAGIHAELASQFPRMAMRVVDRPRANNYGPYGLAVGRWANGVRCLYAWQWIDELKNALVAGGKSQVSLRVRLCSKDHSLDQIAGFLDRLELDLSRSNQPAAPTAVVARSSLDEGAPARIASGDLAHPRPDRRPPARPARRATEAAALTPVIAATRDPDIGAREQPLDQSLPAAAYRGPVPVSIANRTTKPGGPQ